MARNSFLRRSIRFLRGSIPKPASPQELACSYPQASNFLRKAPEPQPTPSASPCKLRRRSMESWDCSFSANIDSQLHVTPSGNVTVTATGLPGGAIFGNKISATFGASTTGLNLSITTHADLASPGPIITILPSFSGFNAVQPPNPCCPQRSIKLVDALHGEASPTVDVALQVAEAIGIYDAAQKFTGHADDLKKLLSDDWSSVLSLNTPARQQQVATAIANLFGAGPLGAIPDSLAASGSTSCVDAESGYAQPGKWNRCGYIWMGRIWSRPSSLRSVN